MQVGGDGLFSEILNGTISLWAGGGERAAAASNIRLGHIPAGSTDAVAYSLNGTRSAFTAALHIILGDRLGACAQLLYISWRGKKCTLICLSRSTLHIALRQAEHHILCCVKHA